MNNLYKLGEMLARKYYGMFARSFSNSSIAVEDLIQEAHIAIFNVEEYCKKHNIIINDDKQKLSSNAVIRRMGNILRDRCGITKIVVNNKDAQKTKFGQFIKNKKYQSLYNPMSLEDFIENEEHFQDQLQYDKPDNDPRKFSFLNELRELLTENEYQILYMRFVEGCTFQEIANRLPTTCSSRQRGEQLYVGVIKKLRKALDILPNFVIINSKGVRKWR